MLLGGLRIGRICVGILIRIFLLSLGEKFRLDSLSFPFTLGCGSWSGRSRRGLLRIRLAKVIPFVFSVSILAADRLVLVNLHPIGFFGFVVDKRNG